MRHAHAVSTVPTPRESHATPPHPAQADHEAQYDHLEPLLAAYATTAAFDDASRVRMRGRLVAGYLPVARNIARRYARRGEPLEDLQQVAYVGLLQAIERYQPECGRCFLAFAIPTITGEIRRHFRDKTWAMRVPRRLKDLNLTINAVLVELSQSLGRTPRPSDIAARLNLPIDDVLEALQAAQSYRADSLDQKLSAASDTTSMADLLGATDGAFDQFTDSHALAPYLAALPDREYRILIMRFFEDMTQSQIAARLNISQMHVSRLLSSTLAHLRDAVEHDNNPHPDGGQPAINSTTTLSMRAGERTKRAGEQSRRPSRSPTASATSQA
jgi:RNA polymerase sigma-B factor